MGTVGGFPLPRVPAVSSKEDQLNFFPVSQPRLAKEAEPAPESSAKSTRQVSPEVALFIERVVVPALVKRYIAQLSPTGEHDE